jgi:hypothetical protein
MKERSMTNIKSSKKTDIDCISDDFTSIASNVERIFESAFDAKKKRRRGIVAGVFGVLYGTTKLAFHLSKATVKVAPKVVVGVASIKREVINSAQKEYNEYRAVQEKQKLQKKLDALKNKQSHPG